MKDSGGSRGGARGARASPLFLDQNEAQRGSDTEGDPRSPPRLSVRLSPACRSKGRHSKVIYPIGSLQ